MCVYEPTCTGAPVVATGMGECNRRLEAPVARNHPQQRIAYSHAARHFLSSLLLLLIPFFFLSSFPSIVLWPCVDSGIDYALIWALCIHTSHEWRWMEFAIYSYAYTTLCSNCHSITINQWRSETKRQNQTNTKQNPTKKKKKRDETWAGNSQADGHVSIFANAIDLSSSPPTGECLNHRQNTRSNSTHTTDNCVRHQNRKIYTKKHIKPISRQQMYVGERATAIDFTVVSVLPEKYFVLQMADCAMEKSIFVLSSASRNDGDIYTHSKNEIHILPPYNISTYLLHAFRFAAVLCVSVVFQT